MEFDQQAEALTTYNVVYSDKEYNRELVARWVPDPEEAVVPQLILDAVVAVPLETDPGEVVAEGPADATAMGEAERMDADVAAARDARYIAAFDPDAGDLSNKHTGSMQVAALMQQLEELDQVAQRSVAGEVESALESQLGEGACLVDEAGRQRILEICEKVRKSCARLGDAEKKCKLQLELQKTATGIQDWQRPDGFTDAASSESTSGQNPGAVAHLLQPRGSTPLSLWDWRIWAMARPTLWRFGDAANLYPDRQTPLPLVEWMSCMLIREEMEYSLPTDSEQFKVRPSDSDLEINRFAGDWVTHHLFSSLRVLASQQESTHAFLKNGGIAWASKVRNLSPELLAESARLATAGDDLRTIAANHGTPQLVRDALNMMQMASAHVLGTDGHRRLCRHEGNAYTVLFGPPLIFCTPNVADGKQCLLLVAQNEKVFLDYTLDEQDVIPKYRDMMVRLAKDPVGQTQVFHLIMRLFFQHVLGVRPECIESRRGAKRSNPREWCTDGMAASACTPGLFGPIAAFRGEIEAQGRGSLHPHILVWLVMFSVAQVVETLHLNPEGFQRNIFAWMKESVAAVESISQSSVRSLPRRFGDLETQVKPLGFSETERKLSKYDGGSEIELLSAIPEEERSDAQNQVLETQDNDMWCRPCLPLRAVSGDLLSTSINGNDQRKSIYNKLLSEFAVGQCPGYRRHGPLKRSPKGVDGPNGLTDGTVCGQHRKPTLECEATLREDTAERWEQFFAEDVRKLASELFVHICGDSCQKGSEKKKMQICRHGFYYIVNLGDWDNRKEGISFRRRGKSLRNSIFVVKSTKHGMQGRLLMLQEHPFEVQTNYAGAASLRCNFDVQDFRRVLPDHMWKPDHASYPCVRMDEDRVKEFGYMGVYEWDAEEFVQRRSQSLPADKHEPEIWHTDRTHSEWREVFLEAMQCDVADGATDCTADCECVKCECLQASVASFADAINTGYYVNSYTTKQCPTMDGVLENLRRGLERVDAERAIEKDKLEKDCVQLEKDLGRQLTIEESKPFKGKSAFAETMRTLNRLSSSYRRCQWKSGAEMIFPILYGHMTFASHRCWTIYVKKAVFQAAESWRQLYGNSIRHAAIKTGGGAIIQHLRQGMDPYPLQGWRRISIDGLSLLEGPQGQKCATTSEAFDNELASHASGITEKGLRIQLTMIQKFLNQCCSESITQSVNSNVPANENDGHTENTNEPQQESVRQVVTTSPLEDWMWRGTHPIVRDMSWYV